MPLGKRPDTQEGEIEFPYNLVRCLLAWIEKDFKPMRKEVSHSEGDHKVLD